MTAATPSQTALFALAPDWADMTKWHAEVGRIRRETPILHCEPEGFAPFWVLTRHADVFGVARDSQAWSNTSRVVLGPEPTPEEAIAFAAFTPASLVQLDGDDHRKHRQVTNDWFKPAAVKTRQPRIDELADEFVEKMRSLDGSCDFASDIAQPYTLRVIMDIYGVPTEDEPLMLELTQGIFGSNDPEFLGEGTDPATKVLGSVMKFFQYFNEITADRRACPVDDLASVIANGEVDGSLLADDRRLWYFIIVATAGHDTTSYALSGGMEAMARDPDQLWALRDETLVANAADECIRWATPVRHFLRYANADTTVADTLIREGERVLLSYPSANRDETVFVDPDVFDVRRPDADKLLSFGVGAHFCLGSQFARRELRTLLGRLGNELDHIELAGDPQWAEGHFVSGVKHLPLEYSFRT